MARAPRPNSIAPEPAAATTISSIRVAAEADDHHHDQQQPAAVLTVWRKSLLLSCSGFTVFDASGDLAFRVDSYDGGSARRCHGLRRWRRAADVVLMDVAGTPLLTVHRRQGRLASLGLAPDCCLIFDGESKSTAKAKPLLSVRRARHALIGASASSSGSVKAPLAYVTPLQQAGQAGGTGDGGGEAYVVEGSYGARACAVRERDARGGGGGAVVAEVRRKERVGDDVFRLVAGPRLGAPLAVALVIALDEMFADDGGGGCAGSGAGTASARWPSMLRRTWSA